MKYEIGRILFASMLLLVCGTRAFAAPGNWHPDLSGFTLEYPHSVAGQSVSELQKNGAPEDQVLDAMNYRHEKGLSHFQYLQPGCEKKTDTWGLLSL